jgi:hypothetical protein
MTRNVGTVDRVIRIVLALALFSLFFLLEGSARWFGVIGVVPLLTAFVSFCPLYTLFGFSTCPAQAKKS